MTCPSASCCQFALILGFLNIICGYIPLTDCDINVHPGRPEHTKRKQNLTLNELSNQQTITDMARDIKTFCAYLCS